MFFLYPINVKSAVKPICPNFMEAAHMSRGKTKIFCSEKNVTILKNPAIRKEGSRKM